MCLKILVCIKKYKFKTFAHKIINMVLITIGIVVVKVKQYLFCYVLTYVGLSGLALMWTAMRSFTYGTSPGIAESL